MKFVVNICVINGLWKLLMKLYFFFGRFFVLGRRYYSEVLLFACLFFLGFKFLEEVFVFRFCRYGICVC